MYVKPIPLCIILLFAFQLQAQTEITNTDSVFIPEIPVAPVSAQAAASANPNISVIGDFQGLYRSFGNHNFDAVLNEVEFSFESVIDPYARANFYYAVGQDAATGEFESEIEEAYVTTLSLPAQLQLKAGRFKQNAGRVNMVHSHALPVIDVPDVNAQFFGEEGLKGDGLSLSWLVPNSSFFQELTVEATNPAEGPVFQRSQKNNFLYLAHLKNFWDLTSNATLELGLTAMQGENPFAHTSQILAADLTYKWKPVQFNTYKSMVLQNELMWSHSVSDSATINAIGFYSMLNTQVAKRLFLAGRYDYTNAPFDNSYVQQSGSLTLGWYATEFQKIELQVKHTAVNEALEEFDLKKNYNQVMLRWIFVIGAHGAHMY